MLLTFGDIMLFKSYMNLCFVFFSKNSYITQEFSCKLGIQLLSARHLTHFIFVHSCLTLIRGFTQVFFNWFQCLFFISLNDLLLSISFYYILQWHLLIFYKVRIKYKLFCWNDVFSCTMMWLIRAVFVCKMNIMLSRKY